MYSKINITESRKLDAEETFKILKMLKDLRREVTELKEFTETRWSYSTEKLNIEFIVTEKN